MDLIEKAAARLTEDGRLKGEEGKPAEDKPEARRAEEAAPATPAPTHPAPARPEPAAVDALPPVDELTDTGFLAEGRTKNFVRLDLQYLQQAGMVVPDASRSKIKEEYRHIKRPLLMNAAGKGASVIKHANLIMVSSAHPNEGKTFSAINLALSIAAERDKTVLLVDADVVRPTVAGFLGIRSEVGLVDYLVKGDIELPDILVRTDLPTLSILPAGNPHHLSTELLASEGMHALMEELSTRYSDRIVIFDAPPLLVTTEACVLASMMGQIVLVVEAERTTRADIKEALERLQPNPEIAVGLILNKSLRATDSSYYGYGYGYYG